jgi:hypothetical protein
MRKFKFLKKANEENVDPFANIPNEDEGEGVEVGQANVNRAFVEGLREQRKRERRIKQQRKELRKPYAVYYGDSQALLRGEPADQSLMHFYHDSLPEYRDDYTPEGVPMVHQMKRALEAPGSGHKKVFLAADSYKGLNEQWDRLAPNGLTVYVPHDAVGTIEGTATSPVLRSRTIANLDRTNTALRSETGRQPNVDELDPSHPLNILKEHGPEALIRDIFTDDRRPLQTDSLDDESKLKTCICGHSEEAHQDGAQNRRLHDFIPKYVMGADGQLKPGVEVRAQQSPLLFSRSPENYSDDPASPGTNNKLQLADRISESPKMPVVTVGIGGVRIRRLDRVHNGLDQYGQKFNDVVAQGKPKEKFKICPGQFPGTKYHIPCNNGSLDRVRHINDTFCDTCLPGEPIYSEDGKRLIGEGLGKGRIRVNNIEDAPDHELCDGRGYTEEIEGNELIKKPCKSGCINGKDASALERKGAQCPDCNSPDGVIHLTDANRCPICNGQGNLDEKESKNQKDLPIQQRSLQVSESEGNPVRLVDFYGQGMNRQTRVVPPQAPEDFIDRESYDRYAADFRSKQLEGTQSIDFIDGFKDEANPNCPDCHGDRDYQEIDEDGNRTPCKNCRIGSFTEKVPVLPRNTRLVRPNQIDVPEIVFQSAMKMAYPDSSKNPHERTTPFQDYDKTTDRPNVEFDQDNQPTSSYEIGGRPVQVGDLQATYVNGVNLTPSLSKTLWENSRTRDVGPNSSWTAGHAQLRDIAERFGNSFGSLPMNVPGVQVDTPAVSTSSGDEKMKNYEKSFGEAASDEMRSRIPEEEARTNENVKSAPATVTPEVEANVE